MAGRRRGGNGAAGEGPRAGGDGDGGGAAVVPDGRGEALWSDETNKTGVSQIERIGRRLHSSADHSH